MPRTARASVGNVCYHVLNRGNARNTVFHKDGDYGAFLKLLNQANDRVSMRLLAFCLMPNHFHLVAWPREDGDLSKWMQRAMTSHVCITDTTTARDTCGKVIAGDRRP